MKSMNLTSKICRTKKFNLFFCEYSTKTYEWLRFTKKNSKMQFLNSFKSEKFIFENYREWKKKRLLKKRFLELDQSKKLYNHLIISKFSNIKSELRLTSEKITKIIIEKVLQFRKKLLLIILYNRKKVLIWNFSKIKRVLKEVFSAIKKIILHQIWQIPEFSISKTLIDQIIKMIRERLEAKTLKFCYKFYRKFFFNWILSNK